MLQFTIKVPVRASLPKAPELGELDLPCDSVGDLDVIAESAAKGRPTESQHI